MEICFLTSSVHSKAGLWRVVQSLADELSDRGHEIKIVATSGCSDRYKTENLSFKMRLQQPVDFIRRAMRLRRFVKDADVLVAFDPRPVGIFTKIACIGLSKKMILQTLGSYALFEQSAPLKNTLIAWVYRSFDRVFVINSFVEECIEKSYPGFAFGNNMRYVEVGVNTELFYKKNNPLCRFSSNYILSVGAVKYRKGQLKSLRAFIEIAKRNKNLDYIIVGNQNHEPKYVKKIMNEIERAGEDIKRRVIFVEEVSDEELVDLYSGARFFVLTPASSEGSIEGFGMVYIEAALCGVTSVGTFHTGAEAAIENEKSGILVTNTVEDIAAGMQLLLKDQDKVDQLAEYAHERALKFDWKFIVDKYEKEIADIMV